MAKTICWIQHTKKNRSRKKWWQRRKSVVQVNEQCCLWKNNKKFWCKRIAVKLVNNEKDNLKWTFKPSYISHKSFDNDLVTIRKSKVTLTFNKHAYIGMWILELRRVLMYDFHYDYIKNKYGNNSRLLFTDTYSLMYEIKTEDVYEDFGNNKEMFHSSNYSTKSKYYDNSNKLMVGKMNDETDDKGILLNKKCLRHSVNRIQRKDEKIGAYEINKISLSCFDDTIYIQNKGYAKLALGYES